MGVSEDVEEGDGGMEGGIVTDPDHDDDDTDWTDDDEAPQEHEFTAIPGMQVPTPTSALGFIQLFLTREILNFVAEETNRYALYCRDVLRRHASGKVAISKILRTTST